MYAYASNQPMSELCLIYCTCCDQKEAERIAATLVQEKLIACANIFPAHTAIYHWQGERQKTPEVGMLLKSRSTLFARVSQRIEVLHSYDTCCVIKLNVDDCNSAYASWLYAQTK